uniref:Putative conserved plasma membrane protein n=1 Tax=Culex tarsalis TaxID=7177 RepID=A0A1Q3F336_CULTA
MEEPQQQPDSPKAASPAELMAARREARRKRILENSNNRLTKITGREHNEPATEDSTMQPPEVIYPDPEDERDVYQQPELSPFGPPGAMGFPPVAGAANGDIFSLLNTLSQAQPNGFPGGMPFDTPAGAGASRAPVPETRLVKFLRTKIHIALLAIVVYLLFATGQHHWIGGSVFVLLLGWETVEMLLLKTYEPQASFLDVVFLLGGISKRYSQFILKMTQTINKVLKDVAFFVFFFVATHLLWSRFALGIDFSYVLGYDQLNAPITS